MDIGNGTPKHPEHPLPVRTTTSSSSPFLGGAESVRQIDEERHAFRGLARTMKEYGRQASGGGFHAAGQDVCVRRPSANT